MYTQDSKKIRQKVHIIKFGLNGFIGSIAGAMLSMVLIALLPIIMSLTKVESSFVERLRESVNYAPYLFLGLSFAAFCTLIVGVLKQPHKFPQRYLKPIIPFFAATFFGLAALFTLLIGSTMTIVMLLAYFQGGSILLPVFSGLVLILVIFTLRIILKMMKAVFSKTDMPDWIHRLQNRIHFED